MTFRPMGLLTAIVIVCTPLALQGQQADFTSTGAFHGGPSYHGSAQEHAMTHHGPPPYGYLWDGYCVEAAQRYACRMHHALNAAAIARQAQGACAAEKFHNMKESIGSRLNPFAPCGHCPHCQGGKSGHCKNQKLPHDHGGSVQEEPAQPSQPESSDTTGSRAIQPTQDPVVLTPVQPSPQQPDVSELSTNGSPRSPVVQLAPAAPEPSEVVPRETPRTERVPRNEIPARPENPSSPNDRRSAAIPVNTNLSNGSVFR